MKMHSIFGRGAAVREGLQCSRDLLYRMAYAWCRDAALADDLAHEAAEKALRRAGQLRDAERLRGWLFRILKGRQLTLLPGTEVAPSALDEVVKRLRDGWVYVRA
jgi:DNA-directed RNA polymerase specialized sigma24 family protein